MYRVLSFVVVLFVIVLAQDALASQRPDSRTEAAVNAWSLTQTAQVGHPRVPDKLESQTVGRLYTLTYGGRELCEQVGEEQAAQFERVLTGFHAAFPEVMGQLEQSSFFEETKRGFSRWVKESPDLKSGDDLANMCLAGYKLLKVYTDNKNDPEVVESMVRIRKILTR